MATTLRSTSQEYVPKQIENVSCMMCGESKSKTHEVFGNRNQYTYVECKNCSNIYLNPRPVYDEDFTSIAYDAYGEGINTINDDGSYNERTKKMVKTYSVTLSELSKYKTKGKLLDLGCSTGEFLLAARDHGFDPHGIDISKPMIKHINERLKLKAKAGQFEDLDLSEWGKFDVIYSSHVIEHIPDPNMWCKMFKMYLKEDGILVLNIPNQMSPEKKLQRLLKKLNLRKSKWEAWRTPDHLYEPHLKSMRYLLKKNNFEILDMYTYSKREKIEQGFQKDFYYKSCKWGSKIRLFAKPL